MNMTLNTTVDYNRTDNMLVPSEEKELTLYMYINLTVYLRNICLVTELIFFGDIFDLLFYFPPTRRFYLIILNLSDQCHEKIISIITYILNFDSLFKKLKSL